MITVDNLSNGDITKHDEILNLDVIVFLNILSFVKDKQKNEERRQRMIKNR